MNRFSLMDKRQNAFVYPKTRQIAALILFLIVAFFQFPCYAASVNLTWDPNSDATYYIVYWGGTSGNYTFNSQPIYSPSTSFSVTVQDGSTYYFAVKAFNDCGNSSVFSDEAVFNGSPVLTPPPPNLSPLADAGSDQSVNEGQSVLLNGSKSSDPDDGIASYRWSQISGIQVSISSSGSASASFIAPETGTDGTILGFRLTVTDHGGLSSRDDCLVMIANVNKTPTANAGADQSVDEGLAVTLNAGGSSDPDDGIASYQWTQTSGSSVTLANASTAKATFVAPDIGTAGATLAFRLTVKDYGGLSSTDDCLVMVANVNKTPTANAGADQSVDEGLAVTLNAGGSSDPDDGIASYQWTQTSGPSVSLANASTVKASFVAPDIGTAGATLAFRLTVKDYGGLSATDDCLVMVANVNKTPTANAGADQSVDEGLTVTLNAGGSSDPDDGIASYQWTQTSGPSVILANVSTARASFVAPDIGTAGATLAFRLTVKDYGGLSSTDDCLVNVLFVNEPPYADAGPDQTVDEGKTVTLNAGNSSDPDDGIASYVWFQTQGPAVTLSSTTAISPTFTAPQVTTGGASITFQLVVQDKQGAMSADTCDIQVKDTAIVEYPAAPVSPRYATVSVSEFPTIEVLDTHFQHRFWLKIGWSEYTSLSGEARVATGDIDGDGEAEIIIGLGQVPDNPSIPGGFFQVLDHDFSHMTWGYVNWPEYNAINGETWPACGDLDGDGDDEIIIGLGPGGDGTIEVFDYDQGEIYHMEWIKGAWPEYNTALGEIRPACGDIDNDGKDEIIAGLGRVTGVTGMPGGYFEIIGSTFNHIMWGNVSWPDYNALNGETRPACGDVFGNGSDVILVGLGVGGNGRSQMFGYTSDNLSHTAWIQVDWPEYNAASGETRPALADIDQDGKDEILTGLGVVKKSRTIPDGMFQANDDNFALLTWGQVSWADYNTKNGETRLSFGIVNKTPSIFVSLGPRPEKVVGTTKPSPGRSK